jgi:ribose-phosphate pyrophosphokinase
MKKHITLNLASPEMSDIKFKISKFPDGQQSITILEIQNREYWFIENRVLIVSRFNSFGDLELIISANKALQEIGSTKIELLAPYFLGGRSDRKFEAGTSNYLKTVICPIINLQNFDKVTIYDPHSDVLEACLNNFVKGDNVGLAIFALREIGGIENVVLVSPDAGALKKVYHVAESLNIQDIVIAAKHRDIKTGQITHTEIPNIEKYNETSKFVIIDDICDGGRTFTELAKEIRKYNATSKIYLIVSHGIFSAGLKPLNEAFDGIFTTNSIRSIHDDKFNSANDTSKLKVYEII